MEKFYVTNCCECGLPFRAIGEGQFVTCPYCGAELSFKPIRDTSFSRQKVYQNNPEQNEPLYYDEDLEGAPGFYGED